MITTRRLLPAVLSLGVAATLAAAITVYARPSQADIVAVGADRLAAKDRLVLARDVAEARKMHFDAFVAVRDAAKQVRTLDAQKRGRLASIAPYLHALGPDALFPMLEMLAAPKPATPTLTRSASIALRASLLEAVGKLRDARALPVLGAVLDGPDTDPDIVRAAAAAIGRIGTPEAAARLVSVSRAKDLPVAKRASIVAGMGQCRRVAVAEALERIVAARPDPTTLLAATEALGMVGSSWAWTAPVVAASGEEHGTRAIAARALVAAFVGNLGEVRDSAATSLAMVDDPSTMALLAVERAKADAETAAVIDALVVRLHSK